MSDTIEMSGEDFLSGVPDKLKDAPISPQMGVAAIALNYALKYHGINTVQEGTLYQQYKLEGRNMETLHLDHVFETATRIEKHLLETPSRLAVMCLAAVADDVEAALNEGEPSEGPGA